jgi:hypothetical protein
MRGKSVPIKPIGHPDGYLSMTKAERLRIDHDMKQDELRYLLELKNEQIAQKIEIDRVWESENPKWVRPLKSRRARPRNYKTLSYKEKVAVNNEIHAHNSIYDADVRLEYQSKREVWRIHLAQLYELERPVRERIAAEAAEAETLRLENLRLRREAFKELRSARRAANLTPRRFPVSEEPIGWKRHMDFGDPECYTSSKNDYYANCEDTDDLRNEVVIHPLDRRRR